MKAWLAALLLLAAPVRAGLMATRLRDPLKATQQAFDAHRYPEVIARLSPDAMQKLGNPDLARAYLMLGKSYEHTGRLDLALGVYQLSTKIFPKDIDLLSQLGLLLHHAGLEEQAQPIFESVIAIHPNNAQAHQGLAEIDGSLGLLELSADHYQKSLQILGDVPSLWRDYSEILYRKRDFAGAEAAARKALSLAPDTLTLVDLAYVQRAQSRLGEALDTLGQAVAREPGRQDLALLRGAWLLEAGRLDEAAAAAQGALAQNPQEPLALWIRARVSLAHGQKRQAMADLERAAQQARRSPFAAQAAAALLERLRSAAP